MVGYVNSLEGSFLFNWSPIHYLSSGHHQLGLSFEQADFLRSVPWLLGVGANVPSSEKKVIPVLPEVDYDRVVPLADDF